MKKKWLILTLAAGLLLSGCGGRQEVLDPDNPTAITVWNYYSGTQKNIFDRLVQEFNDTVGEEKGIIVNVESKGEVNALAEAVVDAAAKKVGAEEMPDIFAAYMDTANQVYQMDMLADIEDYMSEEELEEYVPSFLEEGRLGEGGLYVLPVAKATELLYLNKTAWDEFAAESGCKESDLETWEGLAQVAEKYYDWSGGKTFFGRDATANYMFVGCHQLDHDFYEKNGDSSQVSIDDETMKKLWDNYAVPYIRGYYGAFGRFRSDDVKTGDLVACVGSTSSVAYFPQEVSLEDGTTYPIETDVLKLPDFEGCTPVAVQQGAGMAVAKSDEARETASVEFLKWFTDEEPNAAFCIDSGYYPVKSGSTAEETMKKNLEEKGVAKDSLLYKNSMMGMDMVQNTELYVPPVHERGEEYRRAINTLFTEKLDEYKQQYQSLEDGEKEAFLENAYTQWLTQLKETTGK